MANKKQIKPLTKIDWNEVAHLFEIHCTISEVCSVIGCHYLTFAKRVKEKSGLTPGEYARQFFEKGNQLIREVKYQKALDGDNTMLIWESKQRLNEKDKQDITTSGEIRNVLIQIPFDTKLLEKANELLDDLLLQQPKTEQIENE